MNTFFVADTHFGHANVIKFDNRPFATVEDMDAAIIANWNSVVKDKDEVWHLGDFCYRNTKPAEWYLRQLNGRVHIIWGNHDDKGAKKIAHLFASAQESKFLRINDQRITLYHYAQRTWRSAHHGAWHLFAHSHGKLPAFGKSMDVGLMLHNYRPISLDAVAAFMANQPVCSDRTATDEYGNEPDKRGGQKKKWGGNE